MRRLLLWRDGITIPIILTIPPTSIRKWDSYCSSLQAGGKVFNRCVTEIGLSEVKTTSGQYAVCNFNYVDSINESAISELVKPVVHDGVQKPMVKALIDIFLHKEVEVEDYFGSDDGL
jgi:hypothetical protein